jgi:tetratricopeptide (TPR) repeat protein
MHLSQAASTATLEAALVRIAYKLAQDKLTVFAWDGAEFMDPASRELLGRLLRTKLEARVVVLLTYRPSDAGPWTHSEAFSEVTLRPLTLDDVGRLARHRLMANEVPDELVREINLKTGGNPLYVEELLNAMREAGVVEVNNGAVQIKRSSGQAMELPRTLRGLVSSRVGKLPPSQRLILQLAVTFGSRFVPELVARASEHDEAFVRQALGVLEERDIVRATGPSEFTFAHELVREVLYESIPLDERPVLHAAVARAIETLRPAELDAAVDRLAHHHREAGHREQAIGYLVRAAERFESEYAVEPALEAYLQAIDLLAHGSSPDRTHMLMLYARVGELALRARSADQVAERLASALELAEELGRDEYVARFAMMRGRLLNKLSRFQEGRMWLERAHTVARKRGDRGLERDVALAAAEAHARNGEYTAVIQYVNEALELARATEDVAAQVRCMLLVAPAYAAVGEGDAALGVLRDLSGLMGERPDRLAEVEFHKVRSLVFHQVGDQDGMIDAGRRALDLAKEYGFPYEVAVNAHNLGEFYIRLREESRAFASLRLSYEVATEHGFARVSWLNVCLLGFLDAMRFGSEQARVRMREAVRYAEERGYTWDLIGEKYLLAIVEQKLGNLEGARTALREVIDLADRHGHVRVCDDAEAGLRAVEAGQSIPLPR